MAGAPHRVFSLFSDADMKFRTRWTLEGNAHQVTQGTYVACLKSPDRTLRKNAYDAYYSV